MTKYVVWVALALSAYGLPVFAQTAESPAAPRAAAAKPIVKNQGKTKSPQASTATPAKPAAEQVVTVTGKSSGYQSSIDRRSYSVANDLQRATGGSVADILRNVPSVDVDVQGNVSLRGDSSVTILIDGQPSALMKGQTRSDVLQQLPAEQFERVEVMTNPSAAFSPDGTAGIINLITKKSAKNSIKNTGSIKATLGTGGRYSGSISETYSLKSLTFAGSLGYYHYTGSNEGTSNRQFVDPITGAASRSQFSSRGTSAGSSLYGRLAVDDDLDSVTRLSGEVSYYGGRSRSASAGNYSSTGASGIAALADNDMNDDHSQYNLTDESITFVRKFSGDDHEFSVRIGHNNFTTKSENSNFFDYTDPNQPDLFQGVSGHNSNDETNLKAEYKGPLPGQSKLVAGYELNFEKLTDQRQGVLGTGAASAVRSSLLDNDFKGDQAVHAFYATYQRPIGAFTFQTGLRLEAAQIHIDQINTQTTGEQDYVRLYPTLHLAYKIDDNQQITASYSERIQRPGLQSLNPYRSYNSPLSYSQGNINLEPQTSDSYELGYEFRQKSTYYLATLYYRDNRKQFTPIQQDLGAGVFLNTQANLGHSRNAGLELVANGQLLKSLSYSLSSNLYWNEIDPGGLALATARSGTTISGRASLNWTATPNDFFQIKWNGRGKSLTGQGYQGASTSLNLGYRHKVDDKLAFVVTANDPFDQSRYDSFIDTAYLKQQNRSRFHQRALYLGFTYALGTAKTRASDGFDFNSNSGGR
jgi:outer membrane receptor protein involved in Fe transport